MVKRRIPGSGEIWHINGDPATGKEFKGPHFYIVLSQPTLAAALGVVNCVPITSAGGQVRSHSVHVVIDGSSTTDGTVTGVALCHVIRSFDMVARGAKYKTTLDDAVMDEVVEKVIDLLDPQI